jgi:pimeloyl-ACP methyl ester carboxylesterase
MLRHRFALRALAFTLASVASLPAGAAPSSDPSEHTELSGICTWNITCAGVQSHIRWSPKNGSCWSSSIVDMPFAVVLRGNGFDFKRYDYLQDHLAKNGIASASLNVLADPPQVAHFQAAADDAEGFLASQCFADSYIDNFAGATPVDFSKTAIIGHSRGGETARYLAANLAGDPDFDVRAVVALAPTRFTTKSLFANNALAFLELYGSIDHDVSPQSAFRAHDGTGSQDVPTPTNFDLDRGMKLLVNGDHGGFTDPVGPGIAPQPPVTKGYVNAFLRAWLRNDWQFYEGFIRGDEVPATWSAGVFSQFSTFRARRVIDNFEDLTVSPNTIGGAVSSTSMSGMTAVDVGAATDTPHGGKVLRFEPTANNAQIVWAIPAGQRDFTDNFVLSLRIGQITGNGPVQARIGLNLGGTFHFVDLADYGGIPEPQALCVDGGFACTEQQDFGMMRTIRIPVDDFGDVDDVRSVVLQLQSGAIGDEFLMDNLEFAEALVFAP